MKIDVNGECTINITKDIIAIETDRGSYYIQKDDDIDSLDVVEILLLYSEVWKIVRLIIKDWLQD